MSPIISPTVPGRRPTSVRRYLGRAQISFRIVHILVHTNLLYCSRGPLIHFEIGSLMRRCRRFSKKGSSWWSDTMHMRFGRFK
jgi:hypothetical protein